LKKNKEKSKKNKEKFQKNQVFFQKNKEKNRSFVLLKRLASDFCLWSKIQCSSRKKC
jgi:hypothetical protein